MHSSRQQGLARIAQQTQLKGMFFFFLTVKAMFGKVVRRQERQKKNN
jgi:hypothetical protein